MSFLTNLEIFERNEDITLNCDENSSAFVIIVPANKETVWNLNGNPKFHHDEKKGSTESTTSDEYHASTQERILSEIHMDCDGVYSNGGSVGSDVLRDQQQEQVSQNRLRMTS